MHLEPDAVAERVEEAVRERLARLPSSAASASRQPRRCRRSPSKIAPAADPRPDLARSRGRAPPCRGGATRRPPSGDLADDERAGHVGEAGATRCRAARGRSRSSRRRGSGRRPCGGRSPPAAPCETMKSSAVEPCAMNAVRDRRLHPLDRQRLAVDDERRRRSARRGAAGRAPRPCPPRPRAARAGCRRARRSRLRRGGGRRRHSRSGVSSTPSARSRSASQQRERRRGRRALEMPSAVHGAQRDLLAESRRASRPCGDQLVDAELLERMQLEAAELVEARDLHRADRRCA